MEIFLANPFGCMYGAQSRLQDRAPSSFFGWFGWYTFPIPVDMYPAFLNAPGQDDTSSPRKVRKLSLKFQILVVSGLLPLKKLLREGLHTPCCTYARVNTIERAASASIWGVTSPLRPFVKPSSFRRSSTTMYSRFFAFAGAGAGRGGEENDQRGQ